MTKEQFFSAQKIVSRIDFYQEQLDQVINWRKFASGATRLTIDNDRASTKIKLDKETLEPIIDQIQHKLEVNLQAMQDALKAL